ncbi:MAG TPA: TraG family conjugative transposon ATPase, partial [Prevotella sp.]|nr:TraG family conjugative transposon ATPase [Prevotella sp.]
SKIEDTIINQTIVEYFEAYFNPFEGFTDEERQKMKDTLLLQDKTNGKYEEYEQELEEKYGEDFDFESATAEAKDGKALTRQQRLKGKLQAVIDDAASTEGEKENAKKKLMLLTPEVIENNYLMRIERKLEKIERQKKKLKVKELSFNTYYEFALERI